MQTDVVSSVLAAIRERAPLVQNITNYVVMNTTANALLAVGASPAMVHAAPEVEEFLGLSAALVINIGTLSPPWVEAMRLAAGRAERQGKPWVLDPVGAGATAYRTATARELLRHRPTVLRGNAGEILALAGTTGASKGVDSLAGSDAALEAAHRLAREHGVTVLVTGAVDHVTDGTRHTTCANGDPRMTRVTGLGCSLSAILGACVAVEPDPVQAAAAAAVILGIAGEIAAARARGPGSLQVELLDALAALDAATIADRARLG
jgi:hydroxyethylthiazole kinase